MQNDKFCYPRKYQAYDSATLLRLRFTSGRGLTGAFNVFGPVTVRPVTALTLAPALAESRLFAQSATGSLYRDQASAGTRRAASSRDNDRIRIAWLAYQKIGQQKCSTYPAHHSFDAGQATRAPFVATPSIQQQHVLYGHVAQ